MIYLNIKFLTLFLFLVVSDLKTEDLIDIEDKDGLRTVKVTIRPVMFQNFPLLTRYDIDHVMWTRKLQAFQQENDFGCAILSCIICNGFFESAKDFKNRNQILANKLKTQVSV